MLGLRPCRHASAQRPGKSLAEQAGERGDLRGVGGGRRVSKLLAPAGDQRMLRHEMIRRAYVALGVSRLQHVLHHLHSNTRLVSRVRDLAAHLVHS